MPPDEALPRGRSKPDGVARHPARELLDELVELAAPPELRPSIAKATVVTPGQVRSVGWLLLGPVLVADHLAEG